MLFFLQMDSKIIQNHDDAMYTHYFVCNRNGSDIKFPIKIDFFKISSAKFSKNQVNINKDNTIDLFDNETEENLDFSDDSIQDFINYVHRQDISLNNNNVIEINYLAKKYEVLSLIKHTEEYIKNHLQELKFSILTINKNNPSSNTSFYEDVIANNLEEYTKNESLLNLEISILYRIIKKYHSQKEISMNIINFLFKCLDKYGRKASVLFSFIDINKLDSMHLNQLLTNYADVIDFHFINSSLTKTLYEIINQLILREKQKQVQYEESMKNINNEISQLKKDFLIMKEMNEKLLNDQKINEKNYANDVKLIKCDIDKLKEHEKQINEYKQKEEQNKTNIKKDIDDLKANINKLKNENQKMKPQVDFQVKIISQLQQQMTNLTPKSLISQRNDNPVFTIPHLDYTEIEPNHDTDQYFKKLLAWICENYKGVRFGTWIGAVAPNGRGWMTLTIYDTDRVNKNGLPEYCGGCYQNCLNNFYTFSTYTFAFSSKTWK